MPGIRTVDAAEGVIGIEWIDGASVRFILGGGADEDEGVDGEANDDVVTDVLTDLSCEDDGLTEYGLTKRMIFLSISCVST